MPHKKSSWIVIASIVLTLGLAACGTTGDPGNGNGGNGGNGGDNPSQLGYVTVDETTSPSGAALSTQQTTEVTASAVFWGLDNPLPDAVLTDPYQQVEDSCEVITVGTDPFQDIPFGDFQVTFLDAGPSVTIESGGSAYATLDKSEETVGGETFIVYGTAAALAAPIASDLTATVPGTAEFPAFNDQTIPSAASFTLTSDIQVGADAQFTWNDNGGTNTVVLLSVTSESLFDFTTVSCVAVDDGSFTFPAETQAELGSTFSGQVISAGRQAFRIAESGDAALVLASSSTTEYALPSPFPDPPFEPIDPF